MIEKIKKYGLEDYITIVGFVSNPYPYIKSSDVICITSLAEGFSTFAVEGLHFKKPFISTKDGVPEELVIENVGVVANTKDEFADAMFELICDKNKYKDLSSRCYSVSKRYSLNNQVKQTERMIDELLGDKK